MFVKYNESEMRTVLYVGRINRGKGLMNLVNAWSKVRVKGWQVVIAGFDEEGCEAELRVLLVGFEGAEQARKCGPLVKWSRRRPLTPQTGVRLSHGSPR